MHVLCAAAFVASIGSVAFVSANYRPALFKWALNSFWLSRSIGGVPHQKTRDTRRTPFQILLIHWPFDMKCQIREQKLMMTWVHRVLGSLYSNSAAAFGSASVAPKSDTCDQQPPQTDPKSFLWPLKLIIRLLDRHVGSHAANQPADGPSNQIQLDHSRGLRRNAGISAGILERDLAV